MISECAFVSLKRVTIPFPGCRGWIIRPKPGSTRAEGRVDARGTAMILDCVLPPLLQISGAGVDEVILDGGDASGALAGIFRRKSAPKPPGEPESTPALLEHAAHQVSKRVIGATVGRKAGPAPFGVEFSARHWLGATSACAGVAWFAG
jgi:hypothetical protein